MCIRDSRRAASSRAATAFSRSTSWSCGCSDRKRGLSVYPRENTRGTRIWDLSDGNFVGKVNVLDGVQQLDAFIHRTLERFAAGDEPHSAATLVDNCGSHRFGQIARALRLATGIDQTATAHEAVGHLV